MKPQCNDQKCSCANRPYQLHDSLEQTDPNNGGNPFALQFIPDEFEPLDRSFAEKVMQRSKKEVNGITLPRVIVPARFDLDELRLGGVCGIGGFSSVQQIKAIRSTNTREYTPEESKARQLMIDHCQSTDCPYAVKHLRSKLVAKPKKFANGAIDLALEGEFLSCLDHPNILKIRGIAAEGIEGIAEGCHSSFFLVVDRLEETLEDRILTWRRKAKRFSHKLVGKLLDRKGNKRMNLMIERLETALGIATALQHIHGKGLIYRDLKSNNIGFNAEGKVQLFDFGLCRQVPDGHLDEVFEMSGAVGTKHTMAPEVANGFKYNAKADVFSFAMVLVEIMSLNKVPRNKHLIAIDAEDSIDASLPMCKCWPVGIRDLLRLASSPNISKRPTMKEICSCLRSEINRLLAECDSHLTNDGNESVDRQTDSVRTNPLEYSSESSSDSVR